MAKKNSKNNAPHEFVVDRSRVDSLPIHLMERLLAELQNAGDVTTSDSFPEYNQVPEDALNLPFGVMSGALAILRERHERFLRGEIKPKDRALGRRQFVEVLVARGSLDPTLKYSTQERYLRLALTNMRVMDGEFILSTGGKQGGYWLSDSRDEAIEYIKQEIMPRVGTLLQQATSMLGCESKSATWVQATLF